MDDAIVHVFTITTLLILLHRLGVCVERGKRNIVEHQLNTSDKIHLMDHFLGLGTMALGSAILLFVNVTQVVQFMQGIKYDMHVIWHVAYILQLVGVILTVVHIGREEDPRHPFYHWHKDNAHTADENLMRHYLK